MRFRRSVDRWVRAASVPGPPEPRGWAEYTVQLEIESDLGLLRQAGVRDLHETPPTIRCGNNEAANQRTAFREKAGNARGAHHTVR